MWWEVNRKTMGSLALLADNISTLVWTIVCFRRVYLSFRPLPQEIQPLLLINTTILIIGIVAVIQSVIVVLLLEVVAAYWCQGTQFLSPLSLKSLLRLKSTLSVFKHLWSIVLMLPLRSLWSDITQFDFERKLSTLKGIHLMCGNGLWGKGDCSLNFWCTWILNYRSIQRTERIDFIE